MSKKILVQILSAEKGKELNPLIWYQQSVGGMFYVHESPHFTEADRWLVMNPTEIRMICREDTAVMIFMEGQYVPIPYKMYEAIKNA